jgi:hypothetical protein
VASYESCTTSNQYVFSLELAHEVHDKVYILIWLS